MRYFEDFQVGDIFDLGSTTVTEEEIISFARQFDPQPFHTDPVLARDSIFGGLVASGWHTTAMFMRLFFDGLLHDTASIASPGVDDVRWLKPVRPGDVLRARFTVIESTPSKSKASLGIVRSKCEVFNQADELVMSLAGVHFFGRRPEI
ncbi:MAG: MaoC family dehydratase [Ktedonobacteraceae bacterium]|jgi:acyl dehydratase